MNTPHEQANGGLVATLRAAVQAGGATGFAIGIADGIAAGMRTGSRSGLDWLGCLAATTCVYSAVWIGVAGALALLLHRSFAAKSAEQRLATLTALTLGAALFLDLYWWTRPLFFYGLPASDPKRIAVAVALLAAALAIGRGASLLVRRMPGSLRRAFAVVVVTAWLGGGVFLLRSGGGSSALGRINERNRELPNILLVVNDAMRADVLGCYGSSVVKTPRVDRLAADGVVFERAMVQAPFTGSSFGSLFTGKYSRRHGFVKMTADARMADNITLAAHLKTGAFASGGRLEPQDYHCVTFMTGALSQAMGLMRGFDSYYEAFLGHELVDLDDPWSVFRSELVLYILRCKVEQRFQDAPAADEASAWLRANGDKRFFAMLHTFSTHTPYDPPAEFRAQYCDPQYAGPATTFRSDHAQAIEAGLVTPNAADVAQIRGLYYGGVAHADRQLAQVLDELERQGVLENTLVIYTADHGEELGDHDVWEHNHMFQTNLRVPLIMSWPRKLPKAARVGALVESVDIVPTVAELLGLVAPHEARADERGRSYGTLDGASLVALARGESAAAKPYSFAENGVEMSVQDLEWKLIVSTEGALEGRTPAQLATDKLVPRLFDLVRDPGEVRNAFTPEHEQVARLLRVLQQWDATLPIPITDVIMSERDKQQLRKRLDDLGYFGGVGDKRKPQ